MKVIPFILFSILFSSCNSQNTVTNLSADEFEKGIKGSDIQLIDVRTPGEYEQKHIKNSTLMDYNGGQFDTDYKKLDPKKPVYVYCLSGGRSGNACQFLKTQGFKEVYNLSGGITNWVGSGKPIETGKANIQGLTLEQYLNEIKGSLVLVDFNAVWCAPCKVLKPIVKNTISNYPEGTVKFVDIDFDKNMELSKQLNFKEIPLLILYKNGKEVWRNQGITDSITLTNTINKFR